MRVWRGPVRDFLKLRRLADYDLFIFERGRTLALETVNGKSVLITLSGCIIITEERSE